MDKTTFEDPTEPDEPEDREQKLKRAYQESFTVVSSVTAEDMARQLLDGASAQLSLGSPDYAKRMELASLYTKLAQAYILSDAIKYLADSMRGNSEPHD